MGSRTQARPIRQEGPGRLRGDPASGLVAARVSLDGRRARTLVVRTLLADAVRPVPASEKGTAAGEAEGRARSRFSGVVATATAAAYDDVQHVPDACCCCCCCHDTDTTEPDCEVSEDSDAAAVGVVHACVGASAAVQFVAVVVVVVVRAVAALDSSNDEQWSSVFLLERKKPRCVTHTHTHFRFHSLSAAHILSFFFVALSHSLLCSSHQLSFFHHAVP